MKNKHSFLHRKGYGLLYMASLFLFGSCAIGEDSESWESTVSNAQLVSPEITETCFSTVTNMDGSESVKLQWAVVPGAGGYAFSLSVVDDPENPEILVTDSIIDGCSVTFEREEDTKYEVSVKTLGNDKMNNKDAIEATVYEYSTLVPATIIPEGEEIANYINNNMQASDKEIAFELEAGKTYYLNGLVDFGLNTVTFRGNKINRPTVIVGTNGGLMTQGGLKVKFINFDCTEMTKEIGLLGLGKEPDSSISTEALGYKADGANQNAFVIQNPVIIQECMVKNLKNSLLYGNKQPWALWDFRVTDCIIQLNNSGSNSIINTYGGGTGGFKSLTIRNSTFLNLVDNGSAYFMRYANASNAVPSKLFGNGNSKGNITFENNTLCKTMSKKDFGNNIVSNGNVTFTAKNNIFYDVFRFQKAVGNCTKDISNNTIFGVVNAVDNTDKTKYATEEDPQFVGPFLLELDLTQPNGGLNFKPTGTISSTIGDPRWLE